MKNRSTILLILLLNTTFALEAQVPQKQERFIMDNMKQITDGNISIFHMYSEYDFPYYIPSRSDIEEKLNRIVQYLEKCTAKGIVDIESGSAISDLTNIHKPFDLEESDYRILKYTWGVTYSGMFRAYEATDNPEFRNYAVERFRLLHDVLPSAEKILQDHPGYNTAFREVLNPKNLDQSGTLCTAMIQWEMSGILSFSLRKYIDNYANFICNKQYRLNDGTFARKIPYKSTLWLDDLTMGVPALTHLYSIMEDSRHLEDAVNQVLQFSERMFVPIENLYMHSWVTTMSVHPEIFWGRANGWAMLSLCALLDVLPEDHPKYKAVLDQYQRFCFGLLKCQGKYGMWNQLLDRNDSYPESSGTAIFVYGFARGINNGWLDDKAFGPATLLGWNGLSEQINNMGQIENVCVDTGISYEPAYYYYRHVHVYAAHGFGPVLLAGAEMLNLLNKFNIKQGNSILFHGEK